MADSNDQESNSTILDSGNDIDPTNVIINYVPTEYNEKKLKVRMTLIDLFW